MRAACSFLPRLASDCRGNFLLEFTLVLPVLLLMLVGMLDLGRFSLQKSAMLQGAREGAQYGMGAPDDTANMIATAQTSTGLTGITATGSSFCECSNAAGTAVSCTATPNPCTSPAVRKKYVTVTTSSSFTSIWGSTTASFGMNGTQGWIGAWAPPTTLTATVTMMVP